MRPTSIFCFTSHWLVRVVPHLTTLTLLAGCANFSGISSHSKVNQVEDYAHAKSTTSTFGAGGVGEWPATDWPTSIGGPALQRLVDQALEGNPGLQASAERIAMARAMVEASGATRLPTVGAGFSNTYQRFTENGLFPPPIAGSYTSDSELALNASYEFDFWGKHAAEIRSAVSQEKVAEAELQTSRLMLASAVSRTWLQLARQVEQLELVQQQIELRTKIEELTRQRVSAGLDTRGEIEASRLSAANLAGERAQWQEAIALSRNQLAALLGKGPDAGLDIQTPVPVRDSRASVPEHLALDLLGRRPDIVAARWRVEAALGEIDNAKAQFYPNINLNAFAGFSSLGLDQLLKQGSRVVGIGPAISLPVFEGGRLRAQLKGRTAQYDAAVASYNQTLVDALRDIADQLQSQKANRIQTESQLAALDAANKSLQLSQERERVGTGNHLQVLNTQATVLAQTRIMRDLVARQDDLKLNLMRALGGGYQSAPPGSPSAATNLTNASAANPAK